jgi:hypothetical protein
MTGIGVDRMGALADALARPEILRFENLDTDLPPPNVAVEFTKSAVEQDRNNSYCRSSDRFGCDAPRKHTSPVCPA